MKVDVPKLLRENAYLENGTLEPTRFKISEKAIAEIIDWISSSIEYISPDLCRLAKREDRRTILDRDVVLLRSRRGVFFE